MSNVYAGGIGFCKEEAKTFAQLLLHWDHGMYNGRQIKSFLWRHKFSLGCGGHVSKFPIQSLYYPWKHLGHCHRTSRRAWVYRRSWHRSVKIHFLCLFVSIVIRARTILATQHRIQGIYFHVGIQKKPLKLEWKHLALKYEYLVQNYVSVSWQIWLLYRRNTYKL